MSLEISRSFDLVAKALDYRSMRQDMISSNIANADTPFYQPRDISFRETLMAKKAEAMHESSNQLALAQTNGAHIPLTNETSSSKPTVFFQRWAHG